MDWSTLRVVDLIEVILISAGTLSPTKKQNHFLYFIHMASNTPTYSIAEGLHLSSTGNKTRHRKYCSHTLVIQGCLDLVFQVNS